MLPRTTFIKKIFKVYVMQFDRITWVADLLQTTHLIVDVEHITIYCLTLPCA